MRGERTTVAEGWVEVTSADRGLVAARVLERLLLVALLITLSDGFIRLLTPASAIGGNGGNLAFQGAAALLYSGILLLAARNVGAHIRAIVSRPGIVLMCFVAVMSVLWSVAPAVTMRRAVALSLTAAAAVYFRRRYRLETLLSTIGVAFAVLMLASVVFAIAVPSLGVHHEETLAGTWRGVFTHKNHLGAVSLLAGITFLQLTITGRLRQRLLYLPLLALSALILVLSGSRASQVVAITLIATGPGVLLVRSKRPRRRRLGVLLAAALVLAVALFAVANRSELLEMAGRDSSMTGRTVLWGGVVSQALQRPWLGYGYGAFWASDVGLQWTALSVSWDADSAHNSFLEIFLGLGAPGVVALLVFLWAVSRGVLNTIAADPRFSLWLILVPLSLVGLAFAESFLIIQNGYSWFLLCLLIGSGPQEPGRYSTGASQPEHRKLAPTL
jgi:O-antigen ligase